MADETGGISVEKMKIVIDSETEKLTAGITKAQGLVTQFANAAGTELPKVDAALIATGNAVEAMRAKFGIWLKLVEYALELGDKALGMASEVAAKLGKEEEFKQVKDAVSELFGSIGASVSAVADGTRQEMKQYEEAILGTKQPTEDMEEQATAAAFTIGKTLSEAIDRVATATKNFKIASYDVKGLTDAVGGLTQAFKGIGANKDDWSLETWQKELVLLEQQVESAKKKAQEFDELAGKWGQNINQFAVLNAQDKVKGYTDRLNELMEAAGKARDKIAELSKAAEDKTEIIDTGELDKQIAAIEKGTEAIALQAITLGMAKDEADEYIARYRAISAIQDKGDTFGEEQLARLEESLEARREALEMRKEEQAIVAAEKATSAFSERLDHDTRSIAAKAAAMDMSEGATQAYLLRERLIADAEHKKIELTDEVMAKIEARVAAEQSLSEQKANKQERDQWQHAEDLAIKSLEKEVGAIQAKAAALNLTAEKSARLVAEQRVLTDLEARGVPITDAMRNAIVAYGAEIEEATKKLKDQEKQLNNIKETGRVVTGTLEDAFRKFANGSALDVKDMVRSMLADMATLVFKQNVTNTLSNLFTQGVGSMLGIGGMRAGGGPVEAGVPYIVGEKQPELFVPQENGWIMPEVPQGNVTHSSSKSMTYAPNIQIDARGATPDTARMLEARIPQIISTQLQEMRERGMF